MTIAEYVEHRSDNEQPETMLLDQSSHMSNKQVEETLDFYQGLKEVFLHGPINILLLLIPFAFLARYLDWSDGFSFIISVLALAPLSVAVIL